jgi:hypothetical protein
MHGSNARNLSIYVSLSQLDKSYVFLTIAYVSSSTKLEKTAEQVLPEVRGGRGRRVVGGRGKKWPEQYMYIRINE